MQLDALLANMDDFDYICDESVTWVNDNIIGKGYTTATVLDRMNTDQLIPNSERRVWIRNAKRMFSEPAAIRLGGEAVDTEDFRVMVAGVVAAAGSREYCQQCIDDMSWVKFSRIDDGVITLGSIGDFDRAEATTGNVYTDSQSILSLAVTLERKTVDVSEAAEFWETV